MLFHARRAYRRVRNYVAYRIDVSKARRSLISDTFDGERMGRVTGYLMYPFFLLFVGINLHGRYTTKVSHRIEEAVALGKDRPRSS